MNKQKHIYAVTLVTLLLVSCAPRKVQETEAIRVEKVVNEGIIFEESVSSKTYVGDVKAGDILTFELFGIEEINHFSGEYTRSVSSTWKGVSCGNDDCNEITSDGQCEVYLRDLLRKETRLISLNPNSKPPVRVMIGCQEYPLEWDDSNEQMQIRSNDHSMKTLGITRNKNFQTHIIGTVSSI